jgi:GTP cyclohydrolase I|tara:strand:- start:393 stop:584 length:192 start_codon:yes stop_codon:yes gene_type:complete
MIDEAEIRKSVTSIIKAIGEDPKREGLSGTPNRVAEMYAELFDRLDKARGMNYRWILKRATGK